MKRYILISLILATSWACTKTIDFEDNGIGNLIVLNSIISPDSCVSGSISQSTSILKGNGYGGFIEGSVELYENGIKIGQINPLLGNFRFADIKPKTGNTYKIVVTANGKEAEAETTIPNPVEVISVDTTTARNEWGNMLYFKIKFHDSSEKDYYRIVITNENMVRLTNLKDEIKTRYYINRYSGSFTSDDPVYKSVYNNFGSDILDMGPDNRYGIFPDDYFQGKDYFIQTWMTGFNNDHNGYPTDNLTYFNHQVYSRRIIQVEKLSKEYYNYMKYLNLYDFYHEDPFSEPVPVYSNVKNGAGIFASFNDEAKFSFENIYIPFSMDTIKVEKQQNGYNYGGY
ncbi:MAG: DUF4249 domain-containing protein [Bacteroidota bacterium]|nr:DUF4249 domain-containing protein [Bacteroidota bacterium]